METLGARGKENLTFSTHRRATNEEGEGAIYRLNIKEVFLNCQLIQPFIDKPSSLVQVPSGPTHASQARTYFRENIAVG